SLTGASTFNWYDQPNGGAILFSGKNYSVNPTITSTYFLETYSGAGCPSLRTPVIVTVLPNLDVPYAVPNPPTACPGQSVALTGNSTNGSTIFNWYNVATGGTPLFSGQVYNVTPSATTVYYLETENATGCKSIRTPVTVTILPNIDVPVGTANPATVCPNQPVVLTGTSATGNTIFNWYDAPNGNLLHIGATFNTTVAATTTFFLTTKNSTGCESLPTPVLVTVLPNLDVPVGTTNPLTPCPGETVTATGTSPTGNTIFKWYNDPTAGSLLHTGMNYTFTATIGTVLYLETENATGCKSLRIPVIVAVVPNLDLPVATATPVTVCPGESVTFSATSASGAPNFTWFDSIIAGNQLATGATYTTTLNATKVLYVQSESANGCSSIRTPVTAIVVPNLDVPVGVSNPLAVCSGETVVLTGTSLNGSPIFNWYSDLAGTNLIGTGSTLNYVATTSLSVFLQTESGNGCKSILTPVAIVVVPNIDVPIGTPDPLTLCAGDQVTLTATSINGSTIFHWYDTLIGGTALFTGNPFVTIASGTSIYYLESENSTGCKSLRTPVVVVALPNLDIPLGTVSPAISCPGDLVSLEATSVTGSTTFNWYDTLIGGTPLFSGSQVYYTADSTRVFFLESENGDGCKSLRTPVIMTVNKNYDQPMITSTPGIACLGSTVTIVGVSLNGSLIYNWYDSLNAILPIGTGPILVSTINSSNPIYLETVNPSGCKSAREAFVMNLSYGEEAILSQPDTNVCYGESANLNASSASGQGVLYWFSDIFNQSPIFTGTNIPTGPLYKDTVFYVQCKDSVGCPGQRIAFTIFIDSNKVLNTPDVSCTPEVGAISFSWTAIPDADGYEVSKDGGNTWSDNGTSTSYKVSGLAGNEEVNFEVRATYSGSSSCISPKGGSLKMSCRAEESDLILPYNTFSPNGDGVNDTWNVGNGVTKHKDNEVLIFNRLGQQVFSAQAYDNENNAFDGKDLSDGSYYYVVSIPSIGFKQTGFVILTR
ncbi:MAG: gliding motility-associated C-terminal domain-containing protein, partial [Bacteroidetes bacterium]|nr:gliding motility-associated C-terminal domain-containing protein [Bacteroidota bacterium]